MTIPNLGKLLDSIRSIQPEPLPAAAEPAAADPPASSSDRTPIAIATVAEIRIDPQPETLEPTFTPAPAAPARELEADPDDVDALEESHARHATERRAILDAQAKPQLPDGVVPNVIIRIPAPRDFQPEVLDHPARFKGIRAGRRRGKSRLEFIAAVRGHGPRLENGQRKYLGMAQRGDILWIAPDYGQSSVIWEAEVLPRFSGREGVTVSEKHRLIGLGRSIGETEEGEPIYQGSIRIRSAENINSVRGGEYDGVIIEEAAHLKFYPIWKEVLRPLLITRKGWAIIASTTKLGSDFNHLMAQIEAGKRGPNWHGWHFRTKDSPYIDAEELKELELEYPPGSAEEQQELNAELLEALGTLFRKEYFREYDAVSHHAVWYNGLRYQFEYLLLTADLASSLKQTADYTCFIVWGVTAEIAGVRYVVPLELTNERIEGPAQIDELERLARTWRPAYIDIENVQYQQTAVQHLTLRLRGSGLVINGVALPGDKRTKAVPAAAMMSRGEILLPPENVVGAAPPAWLEDAKAQLLKFPNGKNGSKFVADHDDIVDNFSIMAARVAGRAQNSWKMTKIRRR